MSAINSVPSGKYYPVYCEYDIEVALIRLLKVIKSPTKKKQLNLQFPSLGLSDVFLSNIPMLFKENNIEHSQPDLHVNIVIESKHDE